VEAQNVEKRRGFGGVGLGGCQSVVPGGGGSAGGWGEVLGPGEVGQGGGAIVLKKLRDTEIEERDVGTRKLLREIAE
jgi:hypothetical protein